MYTRGVEKKICKICKKEYTKGKIGVVQFNKSKYCSLKCRSKVLSGPDNPHWRGGVHHRSDGYILIRIDTFHKGHKGKKYDLQHRIIMSQHLGRELLRTEVVHHLNGDPHDNRVDNLEIITQAEHAKKHDAERKKNSKGQYT